MTRLRDHLSAWAVVAVFAAVLLAIWGLEGRDEGTAEALALACSHQEAKVAALAIPRRTGWAPDAVLAGLPHDADAMRAYEAAEARNLERYGTARSDIRLAALETRAPGPDRGTC